MQGTAMNLFLGCDSPSVFDLPAYCSPRRAIQLIGRRGECGQVHGCKKNRIALAGRNSAPTKIVVATAFLAPSTVCYPVYHSHTRSLPAKQDVPPFPHVLTFPAVSQCLVMHDYLLMNRS